MRLAKQGKNPQALRDRPEVPPGFDELLRHFQRLSFARNIGISGPLPIAISEALRYNREIPKLDPDFFIGCIQILDSIYLTNINSGDT